MAIETAPAAAPLRALEPVLIAFALVAIFANCVISMMIEHFDHPNWWSAVQAGLLCGQCLMAIVLVGLMGRCWLGAYGIALGVVTLCISATMFSDLWKYGIDASDMLEFPCVIPLPLLIAAVPTIALRQVSGLRLATVSNDPWSRSGLGIGDIFIAVAFTAAALVFARVGILSSHRDRTDFWAEMSMMGLLGFGMGMLIVVPAVWSVFAVELRRNMVIGLGGLLTLPSVIASGDTGVRFGGIVESRRKGRGNRPVSISLPCRRRLLRSAAVFVVLARTSFAARSPFAVTDRGLQHLRHLPNLQSLSLQNTGVTGNAFAEFESRGKIVEVDLNGATVTDEGCKGIGELKALQELNLSDTSITDAGLRHLGDLTRLEQLELRNTVFQGNGFAHFREMPALNVIYLSGSRCGDGVSHLVSHAPQLYELHLDRTTVTDALMSTLRGNSTIIELKLSGTSVTDDGLSALGTLSALQMLGLDGTSVTGSGFRDLSARRLQRLRLQGTPMSDDSLGHLKRFPRLQSIYLNDTTIGDGALSHFAGKWFHELNLVGTQVTAKGLLRAHFDAGELTVDDQQGNDAELAELGEMYESLIVVPKSTEIASELAAHVVRAHFRTLSGGLMRQS